MDPKRLEEIKSKNMPKLNWREILDAKGDISTEHSEALTEYFSKFVKSDGCPNCGAKGLGPFNNVAWHIQHGEAYCTTKDCGWPYRGIHYDVGPIKALTLFLPYHPDGLHIKNGGG